MEGEAVYVKLALLSLTFYHLPYLSLLTNNFSKTAWLFHFCMVFLFFTFLLFFVSNSKSIIQNSKLKLAFLWLTIFQKLKTMEILIILFLLVVGLGCFWLFFKTIDWFEKI